MFWTIIISCFALTITSLPIDEISSKRVNPELLGGGIDGDMLFPPSSNLTRGIGYIGAIRRWPNKVIPYNISAVTNINDRNTVTNSMNQLMYDVGTPIPGQQGRQACVFFRPAQIGDTDMIKIQYGNGCSATVGYGQGYEKTVNLQQNGCFHDSVIQHELVHVLGFFHEHSRPDRDLYITIHHENIDPNHKFHLEKFEWGRDVEFQGFPYDYGSLMHYDQYAFSKNGRPTITPHQNNAVIGQQKLSPIDIAEIRHYYNC